MRERRQNLGLVRSQEEGQNQLDQDQYGINHQNNQVAKLKKINVALIVFILIIAIILIYKEFSISNIKQDSDFYRYQLLGFQLDDFWKMTPQQIQEEQQDKTKKIIQEGQHQISRAQLGHNSWSFLHMVTGAFPEEINQKLVKKFNVFLILFGQMYPCKMCANHFMELLKKTGPFTGHTKLQLMTYLCNIHNKVNVRLKKPNHSCENILQEWNTCGCSQ